MSYAGSVRVPNVDVGRAVRATIRRRSHPTKNARRVVRKAVGRWGVLIQD